ncbi:hypothetical protein [Cellulomonas sp. Leaf334]|uniref:COG4315 family predicted lipoprotein n=1 Tax=Cellulomonas sp. Leaf334 TaxID=1736339 RepID=UPI0007019BE8|nr:hypothetical protein [Cellulomonas sp. Leaf334]KQR16109.1 hypothetical protein ASF78_01360 [Cellulomonas sp. Leaf334]
MRRTILYSITALVAAATLTACGGGSDDETPESTGETTSAEESPAEESPAEEMSTDLATAESSLGTIVVDGDGMTAYYFSNDVKDSGTSTCSGDCLTAWPPITTESDTPTVEGVTGEVGTITGTDGSTQITIDGRPIYTFAQDTAPGDVNGQGVNDVWWVVAPDGSEITD